MAVAGPYQVVVFINDDDKKVAQGLHVRSAGDYKTYRFNQKYNPTVVYQTRDRKLAARKLKEVRREIDNYI